MVIVNNTSEPPNVVEQATTVALRRFERDRQAGEDAYRAEVSESDGQIVVVFVDKTVAPERKGRPRGNPGKIPAFEVTIARSNFTIVSAHFVR